MRTGVFLLAVFFFRGGEHLTFCNKGGKQRLTISPLAMFPTVTPHTILLVALSSWSFPVTILINSNIRTRRAVMMSLKQKKKKKMIVYSKLLISTKYKGKGKTRYINLKNMRGVW